MKKGLILLSALLVFAGANLFGDVSVQPGGDVTVTWTYTPDYDASFVGLVGDFQGWNLDGALPMEKQEDGSWTVSMTLAPDAVVKYKFNVDGEWTEDTNPPETMDDGFGGLNGLVNVANLMGSGASDGPRIGVNFGMYTEVSLDTIFITEGIADDTSKGFELDQVNLMAKSYWKFDGYVLPGIKIFAELAIIDTGKAELWKANTDGAEDPFVNVYDGIENLGDLFFNPFTSLAGQQPYLGHWKTTVETEWVTIFQAYRFGKGTLREEEYIYKTVKESNSEDGIVEITNTETYDFGGITLDWLVAPNKLTGTYGFYNWVDIGVEGLGEFSVQYDVLSGNGDSIYLFGQDVQQMVDVAGSMTFGDLGVVFEALYLNDSAVSEPELADYIAAALNLDFSTDLFGLTADVKFGGDSAKTLFGNTDNMEIGKLYFGFNPYANLGDMLGLEELKVGTDFSVTLDNMDDEVVDGAAPGTNLYLKPYFDLGLGSIAFSFYSKINLDIIDEATDADMPMAFKLPEIGLKTTLNSVGPFDQIEIYLAYLMGYGDWNAADSAYASTDSQVFLISRLAMPEDLSFFAGAKYVLQGGDTADADFESVNTLGATVAVNKQTDWEEWKAPRIYAMFDYNLSPWDGEKPTLDLDDFKPDNTSAGDGSSVFRVGMIWDF